MNFIYMRALGELVAYITTYVAVLHSILFYIINVLDCTISNAWHDLLNSDVRLEDLNCIFGYRVL